MLRLLVVSALSVGLIGCSNPVKTMTDNELICMAVNAGPKTFGDIKLPEAGEQLCDCIFDVMQEEISPQLNDKILSILRSGDAEYLFDTEHYMGTEEMRELEGAMNIWVKDCKQYRTKIDLSGN